MRSKSLAFDVNEILERTTGSNIPEIIFQIPWKLVSSNAHPRSTVDVKFEQCLRVITLQDLDNLYKNTPVHIPETEPAEVKHNNNSGQ